MANKGGPVSSNFNTDVIYVSFNQMKSGWSRVEMLVHMCAAYLILTLRAGFLHISPSPKEKFNEDIH